MTTMIQSLIYKDKNLGLSRCAATSGSVGGTGAPPPCRCWASNSWQRKLLYQNIVKIATWLPQNLHLNHYKTFSTSLTSRLTASAASEDLPSMLTTTTQGGWKNIRWNTFFVWKQNWEIMFAETSKSSREPRSTFRTRRASLVMTGELLPIINITTAIPNKDCCNLLVMTARTNIMSPFSTWCWSPFFSPDVDNHHLHHHHHQPSHCFANITHCNTTTRAVDFLYMPDTMIEEARNVSVNLHGEHGRFKQIIWNGWSWNWLEARCHWTKLEKIFSEPDYPVLDLNWAKHDIHLFPGLWWSSFSLLLSGFSSARSLLNQVNSFLER